jgi:hypothetical protein
MYIEVKEGQLYVEPYDYVDHDAILTASCKDIVRVMGGRLGYDKAIENGVFVIEGDVEKAAELKKLVVIAGYADRKQIEKCLRSHGFCAAAWAADFEEAKQRREESAALCILRVSTAFMTGQEIKQAEGCSYGDCVYDEPEDLPGNLATILAMLEKHF